MKKQFGCVYHSPTKTEPKNNCETFDCFYRIYVQISSEKLVILSRPSDTMFEMSIKLEWLD